MPDHKDEIKTPKLNYSERLNHVIPGGGHTYSRGDDQYPSNAPTILERGKGAYVWSGDGRKLLDYGMALRAVTLGYSNDEVDEAAIQEIKKGNNLTRASLTELAAAELITELIPSADMVKFAKNGSNVTTAAVKLARAYTRKKYVAICEEHPFFSFDDWFIGVTPLKRGIPNEYTSLTLKFRYSNIESLRKLFVEYPDQIAAVIMEPATTLSPCSDHCNHDPFSSKVCSSPNQNFLSSVRQLCTQNGTLLILDEMITGFRWHLQGAQTFFGVEPDITTFGKAMANGFSVAALTGKREIMELGGIKEEGMERTFLLSTTHGGEMSGLGAFIKAIEIYQRDHVVEHLWNYGTQLKDGINQISNDLGIHEYFYVEGFPCSPNYIAKDENQAPSFGFRTLFSQEMIKSGVLMPWIALSLAHGTSELDQTLEAVSKALKVYKNALDKGYKEFLEGKAIRPVFRTHN